MQPEQDTAQEVGACAGAGDATCATLACVGEILGRRAFEWGSRAYGQGSPCLLLENPDPERQKASTPPGEGQTHAPHRAGERP